MTGLTVCLSYVNQPVERSHTSTTISGSHTQGHNHPCLITLQPGPRQLGTAPTRTRWNYPNWPILALLTLPHTFLPTEITERALPMILTPSPPPPIPDDPGVACPLLLGTVRNKLSFHESFPDLLPSPYLNNKKPTLKKTHYLIW